MIAVLPNICPEGRYTVIQAAQLLGVHRNTILNYVRQGVIKSKECNKRKYGHKALIIYGWALIRLFNDELIKH